MIASLRGIVISKDLDHCVIECAGVGYQCYATPTTLAELVVGEEAYLLTTMVVREDSHTLYAFNTAEQKKVFNIVQTVSGVGARLAMAMLNVLSPDEVAQAVHDRDAKTLQRVPGIGKRVADRMVVDLKGKLDGVGKIDIQDATAATSSDPADTHLRDEVVEALVGLGFPNATVRDVVDVLLHEEYGQGKKADSSSLLKAALRKLG